MQVLRVVQGFSACASGVDAAAEWLLQHLPKDAAGWRAMSKSLRIQREKLQGRGNGKDLQAGAAVAADWLRRKHPAMAPAACGAAKPEAETRVRALERVMPPSACRRCGTTLQPPFRTCSACASSKRKVYDNVRNRRRSYVNGVRVRAPATKRARMT